MDAEDVTQETLIRIWQNIDKVKMTAVRAWVMKTTHNLCIDYLRKRKTSYQKEYSLDEEFVVNALNKDESENPFLKVHIKMMTSKVKEAIKKLPENLRSVFILYELQGMKYKEISNSLNMPLNTVKVNLLRARKKLQEDLKHYETQEVI